MPDTDSTSSSVMGASKQASRPWKATAQTSRPLTSGEPTMSEMRSISVALRGCATQAAVGTYCHAMLVAALAQSGASVEAATLANNLQRLSPGFSIAENSRREAAVGREIAWARHIAEGLRKAGVPD